MDRARKDPLEPRRTISIGKAKEAQPASPPDDVGLTRLFRITPQDPNLMATMPPATPRNASPDSAAMFPPSEQPTMPRVEPVTRFFSSDELLSRGERLERRAGGSGEFETVKVRSSALAAPPPAPTLPATPPPAADSAPPKAKANTDDEPVRLPYLWGAKGEERSTSIRRIAMVALALAAVAIFTGGPLLRDKLSSRATRPNVSARIATPSPSAAAPVGKSAVSPTPPVAPAAQAPRTAPSAQSARAAPAAHHDATPSNKGVTLERAAIDAVAEGRYAAALDLYRQLAAESPSEPAYRDAARILTARLTAPP